MDINVLTIFSLLYLVVPVAIVVFVVKSLINQKKMKEEIQALNLKVEELSQKIQ